MRAVVQRVSSSKVTIDGKVVGEISKGLNILLGVGKDDGKEDAEYLSNKICGLRIFEDEAGKLNKSIGDVNGELLIVSNFTLYGDCRKGRRPSFIEALGGDAAKALYETFVAYCRTQVSKVDTGEFGADMEVEIINDGPITLILDSKKNF